MHRWISGDHSPLTTQRYFIYYEQVIFLSTTLLLDSLIRSLQSGSLYALMAIGLTLTLTVIKLPNFAHAELITIGAYTALLVSLAVSSNIIVVLGMAGLVAAIVALLAHRIVYRPLAAQRPSTYTMILASFATGLILRYIMFLLANRYDLFDQRIAVPQIIWFQNDLITLTNVFFWVVPTSILLVIVLSLILNYTALGRDMRALADNLNLARIIGIPVDRVHDLTWLLVGGFAGIAGALWGIYTFVDPLVGWLAILSVFAASILGGMTSFPGTILGAYVVGFSENMVMQFLNYYTGLDFSFKPAVPFVIIILVLLFRPQGLKK
jgi:branched-subunit amino acid ABC-type transport system permease component